MVILLFLVGFLIIRKIVRTYYANHWDDNLYAEVYFESEAINEGERGYICEEIVNEKSLPLPVVNVKFDLDKSIYYQEKKNTIVVLIQNLLDVSRLFLLIEEFIQSIMWICILLILWIHT